jgi:hypothetical protein
VHPALGKLGVTLARCSERALDAGECAVLDSVLAATREILLASPAPFRPSAPALRAPLTALVLDTTGAGAPHVVRVAAADTLALLHLCGGKAAAPAAWGADMKEALGGLGGAIAALTAEAWEEEPPRTAPLPPPASLPAFPVDPVARAGAALSALEGYTEIALALLRVRSARPVPVPLAQLVASALRLLNLTLDTPLAPHISPAHRAALVSSLPRIWRSGILLVAAAATLREHLLPHLPAILEHTVFLLERTPAGMGVRVALVDLHAILLKSFPAATWPTEYASRLLRSALSALGTLLDAKPAAAAPVGPGGRKSKKRARGAEDALVGALDGRAARGPSKSDVDMAAAFLRLTGDLHTAPLLPPALLAFSLRVHLALRLALRARPALAGASPLASALDGVLEEAAHLESGGSARDVRVLLVALLPATSSRNATLGYLLHPALPPLARPLPPLAQLHMFAPESEGERKVRREMGFGLPGDKEHNEDEDDEDEDDAMAVDEPAPLVAHVPVPVPVVTFAPAVTVPAVPVAAPVAVTPTPVAAPAAPVAASTQAAPAAAPAAPVPTVPFMSVPSTKPASAVPAPAPTTAPTHAADESDDEPLPDLDSGSDDDDEDDNE